MTKHYWMSLKTKATINKSTTGISCLYCTLTYRHSTPKTNYHVTLSPLPRVYPTILVAGMIRNIIQVKKKGGRFGTRQGLFSWSTTLSCTKISSWVWYVMILVFLKIGGRYLYRTGTTQTSTDFSPPITSAFQNPPRRTQIPPKIPPPSLITGGSVHSRTWLALDLTLLDFFLSWSIFSRFVQDT